MLNGQGWPRPAPWYPGPGAFGPIAPHAAHCQLPSTTSLGAPTPSAHSDHGSNLSEKKGTEKLVSLSFLSFLLLVFIRCVCPLSILVFLSVSLPTNYPSTLLFRFLPLLLLSLKRADLSFSPSCIQTGRRPTLRTSLYFHSHFAPSSPSFPSHALFSSSGLLNSLTRDQDDDPKERCSK